MLMASLRNVWSMEKGMMSGQTGTNDTEKPCPLFESCANLQYLRDLDTKLGAYYARTFCVCDYEKCAGYMIAQALGVEYVPLGIIPSETDRARKIILSYGGQV